MAFCRDQVRCRKVEINNGIYAIVWLFYGVQCKVSLGGQTRGFQTVVLDLLSVLNIGIVS